MTIEQAVLFSSPRFGVVVSTYAKPGTRYRATEYPGSQSAHVRANVCQVLPE
jgi:hypothetical protein